MLEQSDMEAGNPTTIAKRSGNKWMRSLGRKAGVVDYDVPQVCLAE
jgi:hypothetical protein